jgi:hypothetical protein
VLWNLMYRWTLCLHLARRLFQSLHQGRRRRRRQGMTVLDQADQTSFLVLACQRKNYHQDLVQQWK